MSDENPVKATNLFDIPYKPPLLTADESGINIPSYGTIHWDRLKDYRDLIAWINHLCEKSWVTRQHIEEVIDLTRKHYGWPYPQV